MSTRKLSDKEFDRYARNLLKKPEGVAFDKAAWAAMEQQLGQAGSGSSVFSLKWLISLGVAVLIGIGYLTFQLVSDPKATLSEAEPAIENPIPGAEEGSPDFGTATGADSLLNTEKDGLTSGKANDQKTEDSKVKTKVALSDKAQGSLQAEDSSTNSGSFTASELADEEIVKKTEPEPTDANAVQNEKKEWEEADERSAVTEIESGKTFPNQRIEESMATANEPEELNAKSAFIELPFIGEQELDMTRAEVAEGGNEIDSPSVENAEDSAFRRWSVGLTLAPDFSTVGQLNEFTRPGMDAGVTVEYFITKRLSITSGAILTRKLYNTTDVSEYTIPAGFWNGVWAPAEIGADCRVIDIPVNFRYRLVEGKRTSVFASAGISSYLMLNERYDYYYAEGQNNGNQPTVWEVSNQNNHFFGVYNLSAGISRRVGRNIYIEAEPFLKNSLGGVGWGQVRLKSTGVLFHLKYNF